MTKGSHALASYLALVVLGFAATPAVASTRHNYAGQFGSAGTGAGAFTPGGPNALAVRQSSGDVFVLDPDRVGSDGSFAPRVEHFDATGDFQSAIGVDGTVVIFPNALALDPAGSASIYVGGLDNVTQTTGTVLKYSVAGAFEYSLSPSGTSTTFAYPVALAVDPGNGTVFVNASDELTGAPVVDKFDDTGLFLGTFDGSANSPDGAFGSIPALAVDGSHRLYVNDGSKARVDRYDASGEWQATADDGSRGAPIAIAADPSSDELYVLESGPAGQQVTWFSSGGAAPLEGFGAGHITGATGIGVNHSNGTVYTPDAGITAVERFTSFLAPTVTTEGASAVNASEATLTGTINPEGVAGLTTYRFDYGLDTNYGASTPETDTGGGSADVPAGATITGLTPGTTYHYRLLGTNSSGSSAGADQTFTTSAAQAAVDVQPSFASGITTAGAMLNATVNPNGADTTYRFEYGTDTSYGTSTADADAGSATAETPVATPVTGLQPGITYHFRVVAENGVGSPAQGVDATFTTAPATAPSASEVMSNSATLNATVIPGATGGSYHFEYGTDTSYGTNTSETGMNAGTGEKPVSVETFQLTPGTTYHFRLVATINGQTVSSDDATFTTVPAALVVTMPVTDVTPTSATLNASIDTHGVAGTVTFAVTSPDSAYAANTHAVSLAATSGPQSVSVSLAGLPPGAEYIANASTTVAGTTAWGEQVSFSTPQLPPFTPTPPPPSISAIPYGCVAPHIDPVNVNLKAGSTVTVTGSDLGIGGTIAVGSTQLQPINWSASAITFQVPRDTTGTQPLTINCGTVSNTVALAVPRAPSNAFTITKVSVKGATATLTVRVPGPGKLKAISPLSLPITKTLTRASTSKITIHLTNAAIRTLAKAPGKQLISAVRLTFTPVGGTAAGKTRTITFKRGGSR